jgi:sulfite exporter TauE/SafE
VAIGVEPFDISLMLLLGLTSSLHCVTMCGPMVAVASAPPVQLERERAPVRLVRWQAGYHLGRGVTYVLLGIAFATLGAAVISLSSSRHVGALLQLVLGACVVGFGLRELPARRSVRSRPDGVFTRAVRRWVTAGSGAGMFALGLATGLFPCGVLYVALARSAAAGSAWGGAAVMGAFWLGTVPLLAFVGVASRGLLRAAGRHAGALLCCAMLATGGWLASRGALALTRPSQGCPFHSTHH